MILRLTHDIKVNHKVHQQPTTRGAYRISECQLKCKVNTVIQVEKSELHIENEDLELTFSTQEDQEWPGQVEHAFLYN